MCFFSQITKTTTELQNRFDAKFEETADYSPDRYNGFVHPATPIISNKSPNIIQMFNWGLIPHWAKDDSIRKHTLNARIETIKEKPSFKFYLDNRCLVIADGFFEWRWLDAKGKKKEKYLITLPDKQSFAFAGLYNTWVDKSTGELLNTYTILTTEANELMSHIHNSKKRMPVILSKNIEKDYLIGGFDCINGDIELITERVE